MEEDEENFVEGEPFKDVKIEMVIRKTIKTETVIVFSFSFFLRPLREEVKHEIEKDKSD